MWVAFIPGWRLVVAFVMGKRPHQSADVLLDRVLYITDAHMPFSTSDQCPSIAGLCSMPTAWGTNRTAKGIEDTIPQHYSCRHRGCGMPKL